MPLIYFTGGEIYPQQPATEVTITIGDNTTTFECFWDSEQEERISGKDIT